MLIKSVPQILEELSAAKVLKITPPRSHLEFLIIQFHFIAISLTLSSPLKIPL
jgi:hypothetical protein